MARGRARETQQKPAKRSTKLGPRRPTVDVGTDFWDDPDDGAGSAGVREPRRPLPTPLSAAGELPEPEPFTYLKLADARY
jgi:hypothetical protein